MTVLMLIFAVGLLLLNLNGYKRLFKSSEQLSEEMQKALNKVKSETERNVLILVSLVFTSIVLLLTVIYYIIAGTMVTNLLIVVLSVVFGVSSICAIFKLPKILNGEYKLRVYERLLVPVATFYHCYFIYFLLTN